MVEITEIRIKLMEGSEDRLRAFCSITIDQSFVVRDLKIIDGTNGPFVAMPSRKLTGHCNRCGSKNHLRAGYCNHCGSKQSPSFGNDSPQKLYADVAHPINSECREMIQTAVITEFEAELSRAAQPGYRSRYDDDFDAGDYDESDYADSKSGAAVSVKAGDGSGATRPVISRSPAAEPTETARPAEPVQPIATEPVSRPAPSFGAGLFDDAAADSDVETTHPSSPDDLLVRSEGGRPGQAIPAPHMRREARKRQPAPVLKNQQGSDSNAEPKSETTEPENGPSFGAGILDD
ncbi:septation protein SpoVG family protein [Neorhodopirellula lusitana]|uniref:septation protein SpoVG family protein n=1 Tax=Neorhodopirellula lusitana TaxID=445327 RepID=UPI0038515CD2